jgi:hypothetical protein
MLLNLNVNVFQIYWMLHWLESLTPFPLYSMVRLLLCFCVHAYPSPQYIWLMILICD